MSAAGRPSCFRGWFCRRPAAIDTTSAPPPAVASTAASVAVSAGSAGSAAPCVSATIALRTFFFSFLLPLVIASVDTASFQTTVKVRGGSRRPRSCGPIWSGWPTSSVDSCSTSWTTCKRHTTVSALRSGSLRRRSRRCCCCCYCCCFHYCCWCCCSRRRRRRCVAKLPLFVADRSVVLSPHKTGQIIEWANMSPMGPFRLTVPRRS